MAMNGNDLRIVALEDRKRRLGHLVGRVRVHQLLHSETFIAGERFLDIEKHQDFLPDSRLNYRIHEWELEIIATEAILHAAVGTKTMRDWPTLANIVNRLRRLENELFGDIENADIQIEMSRIMRRQIAWQQFPPATFARTVMLAEVTNVHFYIRAGGGVYAAKC
jgi:hypothetical protein